MATFCFPNLNLSWRGSKVGCNSLRVANDFQPTADPERCDGSQRSVVVGLIRSEQLGSAAAEALWASQFPSLIGTGRDITYTANGAFEYQDNRL